MDVGKRVQVLVLVHLEIRLAVGRIEGLVHGKYLPLQVLVLAAEHVTLTHLFLNSLDEVTLHLVLGRQVGQIIV